MSSDFTDGGGCLTDGDAGIALLLDAGAFTRGDSIITTGTVDDRYAQRTLRVASTDLDVIGTATEPAPIERPTGSVGEETECRLVLVSGLIAGTPTSLSSGLAYEIDDGSGAVRV
ncbi:MAG: hypothetical protein M3P14_01140, partial [Chloroflexota bacterium]|nr:hypothetical protein [Chloroflexota bacterium]